MRLSGVGITGEEAEVLRAGREETDLRLLKKLYFNGYALFPDETTSSFYYSLIEKDPDAYDPPIQVEGNSRSVKIALLDGKITSDSIEKNIPLHILAYDNYCYRQYTVYCTTLPLVSIESEIESIHGTQKDRDLKFTLFDNRAEARQRLIERNGLIHVRGNDSTTVYPKQAYKMTLMEKTPGKNDREADQSLLGMREDGEWILYAGYNDQERIRNVFSSGLWFSANAGENEFGMRNGNEYRFVELFMNGKYWGLYAFGTPLDSKQMRPLKNPETVDHVYVFKKSFWNEDYSTLPEDLLMRDFEIKGEDTRENEAEARRLLAEYDALVRDNVSFEGSAVRADMLNAIDTWLFVDLVQGMDTVAANGEFVNMFITLAQTEDETVGVYTPWDLDLTWGNLRKKGVRNSTQPYGIEADDNSYVMLRNPANWLVTEDPGRIIDRYRELRAGPWSDDVIQKMIAEYEQDIFDSGAYLRDIEKWPGSTQEDPELKLSVFSEYVLARLEAMDEFVEIRN